MGSGQDSAVDQLLQHAKFGSGIGLGRMQRLLQPLFDSDWGREFQSIRITGSNGKGTVTALVHSMLRFLEPNCGRYTSPHLLKFNERIVLGDREITDGEIQSSFEWISREIDKLRAGGFDEAFGSFELITALCGHRFFDSGVVTAVMEAGIGGRYDPVRVFEGSLVGLTSIDLEHTDLLGKTKELIAYDKIDLCPDGGTVVAVRRDPRLWQRMEAYCRLRHVRLIDAKSQWQIEVAASKGEDRFSQMDVQLVHGDMRLTATVPLAGTFHLDNIVLACSLVQLWASERGWEPSRRVTQAMVDGLQQVYWPGRFQQISKVPPVFIDVGHSPDACSRLVESIKEYFNHVPILLVTGVSHNKAVEEILKLLVPVASGVVCTRAYHMGERVDVIADIVGKLLPDKELWRAKDIEQAAVLAREISQERGMTVIVAGGLFLAIEFMTAWQGSDPKKLRFY